MLKAFEVGCLMSLKVDFLSISTANHLEDVIEEQFERFYPGIKERKKGKKG